MHKLLVVCGVLSVMCLMAGCGGGQVVTKQEYPRYTALLIKSPSLDRAIISDMNEDERKSYEENKDKYCNTFMDEVFTNVSKEKIFAKIDKVSSTEENPLTLDCAFTCFDAGNRAMRYFLGWGAGKTKVEMQCKLLDSKGLLKAETEQEDVWGPFRLSAPETYFSDFIASLGDDFANFVIDYMREPLDTN